MVNYLSHQPRYRPSMATCGSGWKGSIVRFWRHSYVADYIGVTLLVAAYVPVQLLVEPFHRMFSLDDRSKSYPYATVQRVSSLENLLVSGVGPLVVFIVWAILFRPGFHKAHVTILGLFISLALTSLITDIVKNTVGRPRPDVIARCKPISGTPAHELVTIAVCTETEHHLLHDGWRSFPSGHSSFAFSGLGYLALFIAGQIHLFRPRADLASVMVFLAPLTGAAMIAMSRLSDYRHDVFDVTVGSSLGMLVAYSTYTRYYRGLRHPRCHEVYPSKADHAKRHVLRKDRDEEQRLAELEQFDLSDNSDASSERFPLNSVREEEEREAG